MCKKQTNSKTQSDFQKHWYLQALPDLLYRDKFIEAGQTNIARWMSCWGILKQSAY